MTFARFTPQQHDTYAALRALGEMVVTPRDARQLQALKRRGLVRFSRVGGVRTARLRITAAQARRGRRTNGIVDNLIGRV